MVRHKTGVPDCLWLLESPRFVTCIIFSDNIHHFIFFFSVVANIVLSLPFSSISAHSSSWFASKRWNKLLSHWTTFPSISDTCKGCQGNMLYTKTREVVLMRVGTRKGGAEKVGEKGNFSCDSEEREKHKKLCKQWGHCLFQPLSLAHNHAATLSSWQLVRDTSKIFDYKQRWAISLVLGFVKSTCYMTKPKCWVSLDSTPVASAVLGECSDYRWSVDILVIFIIKSLWLKVSCELPQSEFRINTDIFYSFLQAYVGPAWVFVTYWKIWMLPFVGEGFGIVQGHNSWMK